MTTITHPTPGHTGDVYVGGRIVRFENGQAEVTIASLVRLVARRGYGVAPTVVRDVEAVRLEDLTAAELREFARAHDVDVTGIKRKDDLVDALQTATTVPVIGAEGGQESRGGVDD